MRKYKFLVTLGVFLAVTSYGTLHRWNQKMQELSRTLSEIAPVLSSQKKSKETIKQLQKNVKKLSDLVHGLKMQPGGQSLLPPDADPSVPLMTDLFEREIKRAHTALREGHIEYSKGVLRNVTSYCIACHSRNNSGPDFPGITLTPKTESLSRIEKAQLLAATRQFDGALEEFKSLASDAEYANSSPIEWERAVRQAIGLAVRVKQDPDDTLAIVSRVLDLSSPVYLKQYTSGWRESITKWKAEATKNLTSEVALFNEAKRLLAEGRGMQKYQIDHAGDIYFLRATAVIHDQLRVAPHGKFAAEGMFLLGQAYEVLGDVVLYPIHEMYYEGCIRKVPNTDISAQCYSRYEESVYFGYSGSGGTHIPDEVLLQLKELKKLAKPKKDLPSPYKGFFGNELN